MSSPQQLSPLADPVSLARLQVLIIPVHPDTTTSSRKDQQLTDSLFEHWAGIFRKHHTLRGDEILHSSNGGVPSRSSTPTQTHKRTTGAASSPIVSGPRARFLPQHGGSSISRSANTNHVHLAFPSQPPAKHLYPLSLLRMSAFPMVVIGIALDTTPEQEVEGYSLGQVAQQDVDVTAAPTAQHDKDAWRQAFDRTLAAMLPATSAFPLVKRLILVPPTAPITGASRRSPPSSTRPSFNVSGLNRVSNEPFVRAPSEGADSWSTLLLGDIVGQVFGELGELAASLESPEGVRTLSGTLLPSLSATLQDQRSYSPTAGEQRSQSATDRSRPPSITHSTSLPVVPTTGSTQTTSRALTPGGRPTSVQGPSAPPIQSSAIAPAPQAVPASSNPFRRSVALASPFNRSSTGPPASGAASAKDNISRYTSAPLTGIAGGRLLKLLGDMYLLTGMYVDAIRCYDEGSERSRSVGDVLWEALAREGRAVAGIGEAWEGRDGSSLAAPFPTSPVAVEVMSHYLSSLACLSRSPLPFPPTILSPAPLTPKGSFSFHGGSMSPARNIGTGEGLLAWLYSSLCLKISHFVLTIFAAGGWGSIAVSSLVAHTMPRSFPPVTDKGDVGRSRTRKQQLAGLASQSQLTRHAILGHALAALGPFRRALTKAEQLAATVEVVWVARWLEMQRKEAAISRDVVNLIGQIVVEGREENRRYAQLHPGLHMDGNKWEAAHGLGLGHPQQPQHPPGQQAVGVTRRRVATEGNAGVIHLVERISTVLGLELLNLDGQPGQIIHSASTNAAADRFGWPELQVEVLKEGIAAAEALPDPASTIRLCVSALSALHSYLSPQNQTTLAKIYPRALSTIRRRGLDFGTVPWWLPGRVVLSVEISSLVANKVPYAHTRELGKTTEGHRDPFLYNPRARPVGDASKTVLVVNEQVDVFVTLQNVFAFDLEIQDLSLVTTGVPFVTSPLPLILPASSVQTVRVTGNAPTAGSLQIRGVSLRLVDGSSAQFLLPVMDSDSQQREGKRRSRAAADTAKTKHAGLEARNSVRLSTDSVVPAKEEEHQWLNCEVVEEQPLLWIKKTSLTHGTIMLYNGEMCTIRITLENSSSVPVDFVKLSFEDSVSRDATAALAEGELSPEQVYALEYDMIERPVFTWDNVDVSIPPGGRTTLVVHVLGKVGCTDGTIRIDYGYVNRSGEPSSIFHTRRLPFPVLFTVYHTLECHGMDLVKIRPSQNTSPRSSRIMSPPRPSANGAVTPRSSSAAFRTSAEEDLRLALAQQDDSSVLFCINVRNVYGVPFEVALSPKPVDGKDESESAPSVTRLVPPGATERLVMPLPRQAISSEDRARPIPSLSGRQYVVEKAKKSSEEITRQRELFWFRERLLELVDVSWREPGSLRAGNLSVRHEKLSPAHLEALRADELTVSVSVEPRDHRPLDELEPMDFVDLRITVSNRLHRSVRPFVRLEALPTSSTDASWSVPAPPPPPRRGSSLPAQPVPVAKTVAFDGLLDTLIPPLAAGESGSHVIGAVLLASGSYTFRAVAEEVGGEEVPRVAFSRAVSVNVA